MLLWALACLLGQEEPEGIEFFEKKIRPLLAEHCYECHSAQAKTPKGGLRLDSAPGIKKGGDTGPALRPGDPEQSLLIRAVRWTDPDLRMPPKKRLGEDQVSALVRWIAGGAPAPSAAPAAAPGRRPGGMSIEVGRSWWAYRPPRKPRIPAVRDASWPRTDLDRFLLHELEARALRPAPEAPREVLLRRVFFDLVGLPPQPEELEELAKDPSGDAYEKVVDRLLASPAFGERWGRHWLDVARYAESLTLRGFVLKDAWRYRDYVLWAFNTDLPFDRFIRDQVAGDLAPAQSLEERRRNLTAVTFLAMGNTNLEEQDKRQLEMDVVDEQLETLGRAFLAQTLGCARCHDHKFDPIPTRDYYALAGILKNSRTLEHENVSKGLEAFLPVDPATQAAIERREAALAALDARIKAAREEARGSGPRGGSLAGVLAPRDIPGIVVDDTQAQKVGEWKVSTYTGTYIGSGYVHDQDSGKGEKSLTFHPDLVSGTYEVRFAYSPGENRAPNVPVTILSAEGEKTVVVDERKDPPIDHRFLSLGLYRFENNQGYVIVSNDQTRGHVTADAVVFLPQDPARARAASPPPGGAPVPGKLAELEAERQRLQASGPEREAVLTVQESKEIADLPVHIRGSVHSLGEKVPRGFLQVAMNGNEVLPSGRESGRRELADWLSSPEQPLSARVFVNRVWHWLFGAGLVRTPDNFGTTGEAPSHPELLDYLAVRFVEEGWSPKRLIRSLVLSSAYRMSSQAPGPSPLGDPENRLLWRMNRRRLDAECLRDAMIQAGGPIPAPRGPGPGYPPTLKSDYGFASFGPERSVYLPVFRNALPEIFQAFDFADPSVPTGRRNESTVTPQALFMRNSPFVLEQSRRAAARLVAETPPDGPARIRRAYARILGRAPGEPELKIALSYLAAARDDREAWTGLVHALFMSVEFRYVP